LTNEEFLLLEKEFAVPGDANKVNYVDFNEHIE
jgi:hypothetical protein